VVVIAHAPMIADSRLRPRGLAASLESPYIFLGTP